MECHYPTKREKKGENSSAIVYLLLVRVEEGVQRRLQGNLCTLQERKHVGIKIVSFCIYSDLIYVLLLVAAASLIQRCGILCTFSSVMSY